MDEEILEVLRSQTDGMLAVWWCQLNNGQWPHGLPIVPEERRTGWVWWIMSWIMGRIGCKECLRVWNDERMGRQEFEEWWSTGKLPVDL